MEGNTSFQLTDADRSLTEPLRLEIERMQQDLGAVLRAVIRRENLPMGAWRMDPEGRALILDTATSTS